MAICPIARARWYWMFKVACEFACAVKMRRTRTSSIKTQHSGTDRSFWICVWRKLGQGNHLIILTPLLLKSSVFSNFFSVQPKTKSPCLHMPLVWRALSKMFSKCFRSHENEKPPLSNPSCMKSVFEKLHFRRGLVWTVGLTVERKLRFHFSTALCGRGLNLRYTLLFSKECGQWKKWV